MVLSLWIPLIKTIELLYRCKEKIHSEVELIVY